MLKRGKNVKGIQPRGGRKTQTYIVKPVYTRNREVEKIIE